eukprot:2689301-Prymnesium_polylepis.1
MPLPRAACASRCPRGSPGRRTAHAVASKGSSAPCRVIRHLGRTRRRRRPHLVWGGPKAGAPR